MSLAPSTASTFAKASADRSGSPSLMQEHRGGFILLREAGEGDPDLSAEALAKVEAVEGAREQRAFRDLP